ncbi:GNAT family N-acetyltransferase [Salinispora arenicola]|uniref:GNAT family N-acetyltransferase n=1 Tax=Salinispora arenicola TaxID=168697 RepID=UPI000475E93A|nr:GNAT family protein [Salinispora arenicola]
MPQPTLHTDRLLLVPLADRHLDLSVRLNSDPEVLHHLYGRALGRDEAVATHERWLARADEVDSLGYWAAFATAGPPGSADEDEDDGTFVGVLMLPPTHGTDQVPGPHVAALGYRLVRRSWGQGLASEGARALLRHAFDTVGQHRVVAQTMAVHLTSRRVMEAVGMRYVRTYFPVWDDPLPGADKGEVEYELTREMWVTR